MTNKTYEKLKRFIKENYKFIILLIGLFFLLNYKLPYYITTSGGLIDIENRIEIKNKKEISGSFNLAYVNELQATIPTFLIAKFNSDWEILKEEEITVDDEKIEDVYTRDALLLQEANNNAIKLAYNKAGKKLIIKENKVYVAYVDKIADTTLEVGDQIVKVDELKIATKEQLYEYIRSKDDKTKLTFEVLNDEKSYTRTAVTLKNEDVTMVGIMISNISELETNPKIELKFNSSESGSSGGLMMTLAIYNYLIDDDITKGRKIVGTGTIDELGNVGSIGGVKYKLAGAVKEKADLFLVPFGENYEEAKKEKEEKNYDIKIVPVKTLDEAISYLEKN